jgi:small GTP-binding protein
MSSNNEKESIPVGFKLRHKFQGHEDVIFRIAWSPDGKMIASPSRDRSIRVWNAETGEHLKTLWGHSFGVNHVAWSPDSLLLASASFDWTIRIWDIETGESRRTIQGHSLEVRSIAWSPDGRTLASGSDDMRIFLWDAETGEWRRTLEGHTAGISRVSWSPDGRTIASASDDRTIRLWDVETGIIRQVLQPGFGAVHCVAWSPDGQQLASASFDTTIRIWDIEAGQQMRVLEAHIGWCTCVSFSYDGRLLASKSSDDTVRLWRCDTWEIVAVLQERFSFCLPASLDFNPKSATLATLGETDGAKDTVLRIWDLDVDTLLDAIPEISSVHYSNAKVVLVGDAGVGKSGLAFVLSGQPFVLSASTHGRRIFTFDHQEIEIVDGKKETRETLLWDLAGQAGYRLIHQLYLNEVAVALIVFDASNETDAFAGVWHWNRALRQAHRVQSDSGKPMKKFLVSARIDRGPVTVSSERLDKMGRELGIDGYFETSAREGWGIKELVEAIHKAIDWESLPKVSSTGLFHRIKSFLIKEKKKGRLLLTVDEMYRAFLTSKACPTETKDLRPQFETCIRLLEARGLIRHLSFGNLILLQPEFLDAYASAIVNAAKEEPDGLGCIPEYDALGRRFRMSEDERIKDKEQEKLLLFATVEEMLLHEIALREQVDEGPYLVFPSQFTREHPDLPDPEERTIIFRFEGPVLNIYSTLAVRLSHSKVFKRKGMWKNATTYTAAVGGTGGIFLREIGEGRGEFTLFFDSATSIETRFQFEEYVYTHLLRRSLPESIHRRRIFICPNCTTPVSELQAKRRRERAFDWIGCNVCGTRVSLLDREQAPAATHLSGVSRMMDEAADDQRKLDAGLVSALGQMQTPGFKKWAGSAKATLALVFTDIVGSTQLGNELGNEAMSVVRRAHFKQARDLIVGCEGYEIKTIGDSLMLAFRTTLAALNYVLALHTNTGDERVTIRAGIHVGLVEIEEEDAFGTMVNYTARVQSQAKGAEIWMSDRAKIDIDEERSSAHSNLCWREYPFCELKGFLGVHKLWSVSA